MHIYLYPIPFERVAEVLSAAKRNI